MIGTIWIPARTAMLRLAFKAPRTALVLFCLAAWLPGLFVLPPGDRDESRFAQATKQMIETGNYVRIMNGTEARNRKPIGIHWMQAPFALAARAAGLATENPIWPYRLPSLLGGIAAVLATFELAHVLGGSNERRAGMLAGAMLGACVILTVEAHIAKTDAALCGSVAIAMVVLARAWMGARIGLWQAALFWIAAGLGILLKGPVAPMVEGLCVLGLGLSARRWRWMLVLRPRLGLPLLAVVVLPWFVAIGIATRGAFFAQAVGGDLGTKLAGGAEAHGGFPGLHLLLLPLLAFPGSALVICAVPWVWRHRRDPAPHFLLAWIVPSWLVFEAVPTKLPHYPLPLYPALFLLAALWLGSDGLASVRPWLRNGARLASAAAALVLGGAAAAIPLLLHSAWWLGLPALVGACLAGWACWRERPLIAALAAVPLYFAILQLELPGLEPLWMAPRVETALRRDWPGFNTLGRGLAVSGYAEPSLMFTAGTDIDLFWNGREGADALASGRASAVLVEGRHQGDFEDQASRDGLAPRLRDIVAGFNYSRGHETTLRLYTK